jgi:FkbH-like protein
LIYLEGVDVNTKPFSFLEANKILKEVQPKQVDIKFVASGTLFQLEVFLKAEAAIRGINLSIETISFGTLRQYLLDNTMVSNSELILLCPWDFLSRLDWRTGVATESIDQAEFLDEIKSVAEITRVRGFDAIFFLDAPVPPAASSKESLESIKFELVTYARNIGAEIISGDAFSLDSYLASGCPISGNNLGKTAQIIARRFFDKGIEQKKIIVTDLDNTLWSGILGEDGVDGVRAAPNSEGYLHFLYQTMLKRLKNSGALLAVVSKNDENDVDNALSPKNFYLNKDDFISVQASYQPKSLQIKELSKKLNIGLEHFVFIDDNPLEISEVRLAIPVITCILFPKSAGGVQLLMETLQRLFPMKTVTAEDSRRTELYRQMASLSGTIMGEGSSLTEYLRSLDMQMTIFDRTNSERSRAVQLFNKTNQFNINGIRRTDDEIAEILAAGGRLYSAEISDLNGNHGEVLAILIDDNGLVLSYVMSCRVFQRRAEFAFLGALTNFGFNKLKIDYMKTERNEPVRLFMLEIFANSNAGQFHLERNRLIELLNDDGSLFNIVMENQV